MNRRQAAVEGGYHSRDLESSRPDLRSVVARNRAGEPVAAPSICSSQPDVLAAFAILAASKGVPLLVEAPSIAP